MARRLREWFDASGGCIERGEVLEENLAYLLGDEFDPSRAWEQAVEAFLEVSTLLADRSQRLVLRAVIPLEDAAEPLMAPPAPNDIESIVSRVTPPTLVLMTPELALGDHRPYEEYRVTLDLPVDGNATYSVGRDLRLPSDCWTRAVVLERF